MKKRTFAEYIQMLEWRWGKSPNDYPTKRIGRGNPYHCCKFCGVSDPEINGNPDNHASRCQWRQMYKMIQGLKRVHAEQTGVKS